MRITTVSILLCFVLFSFPYQLVTAGVDQVVQE
jgi:hypothetical protein